MRIKKLIAFTLSLTASISFLCSGNITVFAASESFETYAFIETFDVNTKTSLDTGNSYINVERWTEISPISDMIESNGNYTFAYSDSSKLYIVRTGSDMSPTDTISVNKRLPLVGGVTCDSDGNYYVCYGYVDESGKGGITTVDIAKYDHSGNYIASYEYIPNTRDTGDYNEYVTYKGGWATKEPFGAGTCCMTIRNGVLICFMGRGMYNGHQSSAVYAVNTGNMTQNTSYFTYSSHSFNQRILAASDGTVLFADHGDAYPRGFKLSKNADTEIVPFHINGNTGNNDTYAELGGIGEVSSGYVLIGSSIKSDDKKSGKQLFMQAVSKDLSRVVSSGSSRSVKIDGKTVTDSGVIWLTDDSDYSIRNIDNV